jgi:hypothetical protein
MKRYISLACLAAAVAAGSFWLGRTSAQAQNRSRVFELRTYYANPGKLDALQARFRNHTTKIFERHGMTNIGYWVPQDEPKKQNTLIYVLAYPSREAAKKSWDGFRNDPEWRKVAKESEVDGRLVERVESTYMDPADYSPMK